MWTVFSLTFNYNFIVNTACVCKYLKITFRAPFKNVFSEIQYGDKLNRDHCEVITTVYILLLRAVVVNELNQVYKISSDVLPHKNVPPRLRKELLGQLRCVCWTRMTPDDSDQLRFLSLAFA